MKAKFLEIFDALAFAVAVLTAISAPTLIVLYGLGRKRAWPDSLERRRVPSSLGLGRFMRRVRLSGRLRVGDLPSRSELSPRKAFRGANVRPLAAAATTGGILGLFWIAKLLAP